MPDAVAMLARCFEAQWRGLTDEERKFLHEHPGVARIDIVSQWVIPIWHVGKDGFYPISIKEDRFEQAQTCGMHP